MKELFKRFTKKSDSKKKSNNTVRANLSSVYVLIAVVAIIESLILISFTTYSWIETASSLIIRTGKMHYDDNNYSRIPIANAMNYKFIVNSSTPSMDDVSDLNKYFSYSGESDTQNLYRFSRASSYDGKTFFFPKKNNLNSNTTYRQGDIIDSNVNLSHFDFVVSNTGAAKTHKLKFYFYDADVFSVTDGTGTVDPTKRATIQKAMRISFQSGSGTPKIYCLPQAASDVNNSDQTYTLSAVNNSSGDVADVSVTKIRANANQKLFTLGKNSEQNISVRIWLEDKALDSSITSDDLDSINININLKLTYAENDYDFLYFDDYTFSSGKLNKYNIGGHLTGDYDESNDHRMYFAYSEDGSSYHYYPMTLDNSGPNTDANCWVTCDANGTPASTVPDLSSPRNYITKLTGSSYAQTALKYSYFAYGAYNKSNVDKTTAPATPAYKWYLYGANASSSFELRFSAYSVTKTANNAASTYGVGGWTYNTPLEMVYFRDLATAVTDGASNSGGNNFKFITNAVNAASDTGNGNRSDVMYVCDSAHADAWNTVTLYYDKTADNGNGLFKSFVPEGWLEGNSVPYLKFSYCSGGYYANPVITWNDTEGDQVAASKPSSANDFIYTGLGYSENELLDINTDFTGVGCWNAIESQPVYFSTELIDSYANSAYRYQIGVNINSDGSTVNIKYYTLIPDATNQKFYAYIPMPGTNQNQSQGSDYAAGDILFRSFSEYESDTINGTWYGNGRKGSRTYYAVGLDANTATSVTPKGYWNISVIVDGTYEHFFWFDPDVSIANNERVLGTFSYNTTGHSGDSVTYTDITPNKLDEYRWYVPLDYLAEIPEYIYYLWVPYDPDGSYNAPIAPAEPEMNGDETVFMYTQKLSDGIFCVITESPDNTPPNTFD